MKRLFWGAVLLALTTGAWAQATWRGQAEVWSAADAPAEGYVAASNEFARNSLLSIENYKTRKTIQVRVVSTLPKGSSALVLLNAKAAQALEIKAGEVPLVGVRLDPSGIERADNPDPDVNPLANKPKTAVAETSPVETPTPAVETAAAEPTVATPTVSPVAPVAVAVPTPTPTEEPAAHDTVARTPSSLEVAQASTKLDPDLLPLPALEEPAATPEPERTPLPVATDSEPETPVTPGRKVFVTTRNPEPVATETPVEELPAEPAVESEPEPEPVVEPVVEPEPAVAEPEPAVAEAPVEEPAPAEEPEPVEPEPAVAEEPAPLEPEPAVAETPAPEPVPEVVPEPEPVKTPDPVVEAPVPTTPVNPPVTPPVTVAVKPVVAAPVEGWVSAPGRLEGPVLGTVSVLPALEKGKSYVQVGAWSNEADLLKALGSIQSYVPVALYRAEGEKNPWRLVVATAPKGQLGFLLMHYKSQGFRTAAMIKG